MYSWTLFMSQYIKDILCQEFSLGWHSRAIQVAQPCPRDGKRGCKNEKNGGFAIFPGKK